MEEKEPLISNAPEAGEPEASRSSSNKSRLQMAVTMLVLSLFWLASTWSCADDHHHHHLDTDSKVPLDVHIMSKCPDARDCLNKLVLPAMANVSDKVDFRLSMIGT